MKIIFLDIDGVLNSYSFLMNMPEDSFGIDESRLVILKKIVDETGARVVLSSSWRCNWSTNSSSCTPLGISLIRLFEKYGIIIIDKTPEIAYNRRADEITMWLENNTEPVTSYVILDDMKLGWGDLDAHVVKTDDRIGRGLDDSHAEKAIAILNS